jgi:transposase
MDKDLLDFYTDYLIASTRQTSCTNLSRILGNTVSHDKFTRFLSSSDFDSKQLWALVKQTVREIEIDEGILVFDDSISEKPYTDESELICWHYDHTKGYSVKGINLLSGLYVGKDDIALPVCYDLIKKDIIDEKGKRSSSKSKNKRMLECFDLALKNQLKFKWVITDIWFGSADNMKYIKEKKKEFIMPLKTNRKVAIGLENKNRGKYVPIESLRLEPGDCLEVYLEKIPFPVTLIKEEYANKDDSTGVLYLVCSDLTATYQQIVTLYQKRWRVEEYHKSLKNNSSLANSPTRTVRTQSNHLFMSLVGYCKLELFRMRKGLNHFALKSKLYTTAMLAAFQELRKLNNGIQLKFEFA